MNQKNLTAACFVLTLGLFASPAMAQPKVDALVDAVDAQVLTWRHHLHQNAELSYQEEKTAAYVAQALRGMPGIEVQTGIAKTGIKAVLKGGKPGPVIGLRADMDALPVEERNDLPFRSQAKAMWQGKETGVMHACGHDTHVAMLLGAAQVLSSMRAQLSGTIVFLFQPAEEWGAMGSPSGAFAMMAAGVMDNPKVEAVFAQHITAGFPVGSIAIQRGAVLASGDGFQISVKCAGGHGGMPWQAKDPIVTAAQIVTNMQSIVSRQANLSEGAVVVSVGQIAGGNRNNIIPESVTLGGTIRTLHEPTRQSVHESIVRMAQKTAEASGLTAEVKITQAYPVLRNDPVLTASVLPSLERAAGKGMVREAPSGMGAEDFGAFSGAAPSVMWFLNASPHADKAGAPNHSPLFTINEKALKIGVKALVDVSLGYLGAKRGS